MTDVISKSVQTLFNNRKTLSQHLVKIITFTLFEVSSIPYLPVCVFSNLRENSVLHFFRGLEQDYIKKWTVVLAWAVLRQACKVSNRLAKQWPLL